MYFVNKIFIAPIFLLLVGMNFCFCEEVDGSGLISGRDIWRYLNYFDREDYLKQQKALLARKHEGLGILFNCYEHAKFMTDVLKITSKENEDIQIKFLLNQLLIKENDISGYKSLNKKKIKIYRFENRAEQNYNFDSMLFSAVPEQWSENLDLSRSDTGKSDSYIHVNFYFLPSDEKICVFIIRQITSSTLPRHLLLNLYRLDKGPGDICLVKVNSSDGQDGRGVAYNPEKDYIWNDRQVIFIRDNIFVFLSSRYKNFGCMDLACRLDALIVEQMKKQQEQEKNKREGTNQ
jgi:hypothetical protein